MFFNYVPSSFAILNFVPPKGYTFIVTYSRTVDWLMCAFLNTDAWGNFQKYSVRSIDSLNVPYDFDSVMHYASKAFNGRKITIEPLDPNQKIGQRKKLSDLDILQLNLLYRCPGNIY